jgi:eukaryotic-like serine/threonine-protein kinase
MICLRCHRRFEDDHVFCPNDGEPLEAHADVGRLRSRPTGLAGVSVGDRWEIRGLLGQNAFAQVFLALDAATGDPAVIELLEAAHLHEPRTRGRLLAEAFAAAKIDHPHVARTLGSGQRGEAPYVVTEYVFGETLGDWLRRERVMSVPQGVPLLRQLAGGLGAAHRAGVLHRDVKPENVILTGERGRHYAFKIVDFGFAKILDERANIAQTGATVGSVEYMAPEQTVSDLPDARTDVYALGVLGYRLLAGRLPFRAASDPEMLAHHLVTPAPPPALGSAGLAPGLEAILMRALRKAPDNRYPSMDALAADLDRLTEGSAPALARMPPLSPDAYSPRTALSLTTAKFLYKKIGHNPTVV